MAAVYAEVADLEAIWRPLTITEQGVAQARLGQASRMVRRQVPLINALSVDQRIAAGTLDPDDVKDVVVEMVRRVMSIPGYIRQQSVTVDDATKSQTFDTTVSQGVMFIAPGELAALAGSVTSGAFTITPAGLADVTASDAAVLASYDRWWDAEVHSWT